MNTRDLWERRQGLQAQLDELRREREHAFRANSDALARERAGVTEHDPGLMEELAAGEVAGDAEMTGLRRQIELIDDELAGNSGGKGRRILRWLRT